jgi:hypothetical protein
MTADFRKKTTRPKRSSSRRFEISQEQPACGSLRSLNQIFAELLITKTSLTYDALEVKNLTELSADSIQMIMLFKEKNEGNSMDNNVATDKRIYALRHLDTGEFICLLQDGIDYLACFSDGDTALEFRAALGLQEHVQLFASEIRLCPFRHFWLDGENKQISPADAAIN